MPVPTGNYIIHLSVVTPHVQLISDGKSPSLAPYNSAIAEVLQKAARQARSAMARSDTQMRIKAAAWLVTACC